MAKSRMTYSHSRLETFESCALKFRFQYVDKVDIERRTSIEAFLGSRVHDVLEQLYRNKLNAKVWTKEELLAFYTDIWKKQASDQLFIVNKQFSQDDYYQQGVKALEDYWNRHHPFDGEKTIALEHRIELFLDDAKQYKLQGFIDRISKTPEGVWQIRDYKTKRSLPTLQEAKVDRQLALYQIGLQNMWSGTEQVELIWHYLLFDEEIKSRREKSDLEKLKIETIHLIQEVEKAIDQNNFPLRESRLCDWCDYYDICPAKKHIAQVAKLPPKEFKEDEGVQIVDRYSKLLVEKSHHTIELKNIQQQLDELEEEVYRFAQQFGAARLVGTDRELKVSIRETFKAPSSTEKADKDLREQLEQMLKKANFWEPVSQLNSQRLIKLFEEGELPQFIRTQVERYLTPETKRRIYPSKLKDYDENFEG
jgi:putative RecB family exonuclease